MDMTLEAVQAALDSGILDKDLVKVKDAVDARMKKVRATQTTRDFGIGDSVRFNDSCGTRYVIGHTGKVVGIRQKKIVVKLDVPVGRFAKYLPNGEVVSTEIVVPTSIVDLV
jgi:ribosomal protein L21E